MTEGIEALKKYYKELMTRTVTDKELMDQFAPECKKDNPFYEILRQSIHYQYLMWRMRETDFVRKSIQILESKEG